MSAVSTLIAKTPAPECSTCIVKRRHTEEDWREHHPYVRHGFTKDQGWGHPDLEPRTNKATA